MKRGDKRPIAQRRAKVAARVTAKRLVSPAKGRVRVKSSREKVRAYRMRMRAKGLRLVQMWLLDTRTRRFAAQAHQASLAIAESRAERDEQAFIDSVQWWTSQQADALSGNESDGWWTERSA